MTDVMFPDKMRGPPPPPPPHALHLEETDYSSEVDTVLNTPTSWTTDHNPSHNRWSLSSSWSTPFLSRNSLHSNNKRSSEMFFHRRSISPKNHRLSLPPTSKFFSKSTPNVIQEEETASTDSSITTSSFPSKRRRSTKKQRMAPHESIRVQRLLAMVYQFQLSDEEDPSAFCHQLQTYLESWADLKRDRRHVVRMTNMATLRNRRPMRSKRRMDNRRMDDDEWMDIQIQNKINLVQQPLHARIRELETALAACEDEKERVEQTLDAVQTELKALQQGDSEKVSQEDEPRDVPAEDDSEKVQQEPQGDDHHRRAEKRNVEREQAYQEARSMLTQAQTTIAELELKLEVAKSLAKKQQPPTIACTCRETIIAQRDAEIELLQATLQRHLDDRQAWGEQEAAKYFQEKETFKVEISRQVRELAGEVAEQECQIQVLEKRRQEDALTILRVETMKKKIEERCQQRLKGWEKEENQLRMAVATLEAKVVKLEQDALVLYGKNLKLATQLGQWAP
ncbi:hypothetical protein BJV82DRAFT_617171 [Fennellomyces sp. T-0311]|nr:hypothetical protein BJV82DRAFT_617171 [Fennellomyces sp. T-0311]